MKIDGNPGAIEYSGYLNKVRQQQQASDQQVQSKGVPSGGTDTVHLSDRAREIQQASQALKGKPDVQEAKVAQTRLDVDSGTYKVVGAQVATDMLRETFENNLILQKINTRV